MDLSIYRLEKRKVFLHIFFCTLYFVLLMAFNWRAGGISGLQVATLLLTGGAGIGIAYAQRYILILGIRRRQVLRATLSFLVSFLTIGIAGYALFHGFENRISMEFVNPEVKQVVWEYTRFYFIWYLKFAKYGIIFFAFEKNFFWVLESLLGWYKANQYILAADFVPDVCQDPRATGDQLNTLSAELVPFMEQIIGQQTKISHSLDSQNELFRRNLNMQERQAVSLEQMQDKMGQTFSLLEKELVNLLEHPLLEKTQVMEILKISDPTYRRYVKDGSLEPMGFGKIDLYYQRDLVKALERSRRKKTD